MNRIKRTCETSVKGGVKFRTIWLSLFTVSLVGCLANVDTGDKELERSMTLLLDAAIEEPGLWRALDESAENENFAEIQGLKSLYDPHNQSDSTSARAYQDCSISVSGMPLQRLLDLLHKVYDVRVFVDEEIHERRVTLALKKVSVPTLIMALADILGLVSWQPHWSRTTQDPFSSEKQTSIYKMGTAEQFEAQKAAASKAPKDQLLGKLSLTYALAEVAKEQLITLLEPLKVPMIADSRTNSILVRADLETIEQIESTLKKIDRPEHLLKLEAWILEVDSQISAVIGLHIGASRQKQLGALDAGSPVGTDTFRGNSAAGLINAPAPEPLGGITLVDSALRSKLRLTASKLKGGSRILSSPAIYVTSGKTAVIFQGEEVPYISSTEQQGQSTQFRQAGLRLRVTPRLIKRNLVELKLDVHKDSVDSDLTNPPISRREIDTHMMMPVGATLMIGGIKTRRKSGNSDGVPGLPLLSRKSKLGNSAELVILLKVTPVNYPHHSLTRPTTDAKYAPYSPK